MKKHITLNHHIVASATEMRELHNTGEVEQWLPNDPRHKLYHIIKHGSEQTYSGNWGPEHIIWDGEGAATVYCTDSRAREIKHHISDQLFGNHLE
jgi:hypothetical protein